VQANTPIHPTGANQESKNPKSFRWCHIGDQNHFSFEPLIEPNLNLSAFQRYSVDHYH